jgi:hypothetical protein
MTEAMRGGCRGVLLALGLAISGFSTGCTVDIGGQTLPSPEYMNDDVQYFPPGPEFKLAREAAAMQAREEEEALREGPGPQ